MFNFTFQTFQTNSISNLLNKAAGIVNIASRILKVVAYVLAIPTTQICNLFIKLSHCSKDYRVAKIKPLHKKGTNTDPNNFKPISLLTVVSKTIEKALHKQIMNYLTENNFLYRYQSGFQKNHLTDTSLSYLTDAIMIGIDSGLMIGMILIDLQKTFDTITHEILLKK